MNKEIPSLEERLELFNQIAKSKTMRELEIDCTVLLTMVFYDINKYTPVYGLYKITMEIYEDVIGLNINSQFLKNVEDKLKEELGNIETRVIPKDRSITVTVKQQNLN